MSSAEPLVGPLDPTLLRECAWLARKMEVADQSADAFPRSLTSEISSKAHAVIVAKEILTIALMSHASLSFATGEWDLEDALDNNDIPLLAAHQELVRAVADGNRDVAIAGLARVQHRWLKEFFGSHGWSRAAAQQTLKLGWWVFAEMVTP